MSLLGTASVLSYLVSSSLIGYKNYKANESIKESGLKIVDKRTIKEKIYSFIKNYSYLFLPLVNLFVSVNEFKKDDNDYMKERISKLTLENRLTKSGNVIESKEEVKKEEVKEVKKETKREVPIESKSIEEQISYYEKLDSQYRTQYAKLKSQNAPVAQRNDLVRKTTEVDKKLASLYRKLELNNLRDERDRVLSSKSKTL